jgi:hypothetical protein
MSTKETHINTVPQVMVLEYQPELTHSVWVDYRHRCRSFSTLIAKLRKEAKAGRFIGYRLITIEREVMGVES